MLALVKLIQSIIKALHSADSLVVNKVASN